MDRERLCRAITAGTIVATGGWAIALSALWLHRRQQTVRIPSGSPPREAIVLGCRPGPGLKRRTYASLQLYRQGGIDKLIFSGAGEASACAEYAVSEGVPRDVFVLEKAARNTYQNLLFSGAFLSEKKAWIVTDPWHLPRAIQLAREIGLSAWPYPVRDGPKSKKNHVIEAVSLVHHRVRRLLNECPPVDQKGRVDT